MSASLVGSEMCIRDSVGFGMERRTALLPLRRVRPPTRQSAPLGRLARHLRRKPGRVQGAVLRGVMPVARSLRPA
eukprot:5501171-Alexandrium_andersonii.AAC.1